MPILSVFLVYYCIAIVNGFSCTDSNFIHYVVRHKTMHIDRVGIEEWIV